MTLLRRLLTPVAWIVALSVVLWWALSVPIGRAGDPGLADPVAMVAWLPGADPATVVAGIIRAAVVAVTSWMLVTSILATVAAVLRRRRALTVVLGLSPAIVRRVLAGTAAVAITTTSLAAGPAGATEPARQPPAATLRSIDSGESESTATLRLAPPDQGLPSPAAVGPATLALLPSPPTPPPESTTATDPPPATESRADTVAPPPVDTTSDEAPATWTVRPGDSFWRITGELLGSDGDQPSEEEFLRYWERLIEANRSELADPTNPDLLLPGQVLTIP